MTPSSPTCTQPKRTQTKPGGPPTRAYRGSDRPDPPTYPHAAIRNPYRTNTRTDGHTTGSNADPSETWTNAGPNATPPNTDVCHSRADTDAASRNANAWQPDPQSQLKPPAQLPGEVHAGFDRVAVDFHDPHVTSRPGGQPEGLPGCCQGTSGCVTPVAAWRRQPPQLGDPPFWPVE